MTTNIEAGIGFTCSRTDSSNRAIVLTYAATTSDITVLVKPFYIDGRSSAMERRFVFGYYVRIENTGQRTVQLLRRHWVIRDGHGRVREVEGPGVIGKQPVIEGGNTHEYDSFCVLETFRGSMEGTFTMEFESGERFKAAIPRFPLVAQAN
jgi:ApaG protein